jgi:hypothetical protein
VSSGWQLAQVNIAVPHEPIDSPALAEFVELLDPINAIADSSPGFVWRLQDDSGDATAIRPFEDERVMINMSVWESVEALWEFVYDSRHLDVMRRRREWFTRMDVYLCLWWVPAGELPSTEDARRRIDHLRDNGPTPRAFTFKQRFDPPGSEQPEPVFDDREPCPAG